jgi:hypothetical protein
MTDEDLMEGLVAATLLALDRVELSNADKLELLIRSAAVIRLRDLIDESALTCIVNGEGTQENGASI